MTKSESVLCQGPECVQPSAHWLPGKVRRVCGAHQYQFRRYGEMTPLTLCARGCGKPAASNSAICRTCSAELKKQGRRWCSTHGLLSSDQIIQNRGRCKLCDPGYQQGLDDVVRCNLGCGRRRRGNSAICNPCARELERAGTRYCNKHGVQPHDAYSNNHCIQCSQGWENASKIRKAQTRRQFLEEALFAQSGCCGVCREELTRSAACIDHDHAHGCKKKSGCSDCRRSALCNDCNIMLGRYCDDPVMMQLAIGKAKAYDDELLRSGIEYLDHWSPIMIKRGVREWDIAAEMNRWMADQMEELLAIISS